MAVIILIAEETADTTWREKSHLIVSVLKLKEGREDEK